MLNNFSYKTRSKSRSKLALIFYNIKAATPDTDITKDWLEKKFDRGICELTGIKADKSKSGRKQPKLLSVDRIDNTKGYYKNNCRAILSWLNTAKNDMEESYFIERLKELSSINWNDKKEVA